MFSCQGQRRCEVLHKGKEHYKNCCEVCGNKFFDRNKLILHMRTHTKERPFTCPLCNYTADAEIT